MNGLLDKNFTVGEWFKNEISKLMEINGEKDAAGDGFSAARGVEMEDGKLLVHGLVPSLGIIFRRHEGEGEDFNGWE